MSILGLIVVLGIYAVVFVIDVAQAQQLTSGTIDFVVREAGTQLSSGVASFEVLD